MDISGILSTADLTNYYEEKDISVGKTRSSHTRSKKLQKDTPFHGRMYKAGSKIWFHDNGKVSFGRLAEDTIVQGKGYKAGEWIRFYPSGKVAPTIQKKGREVEISASYYPSGRLAYLTLNIGDTTFDGIRYKGGTGVSFYENGRVSEGILAARNGTKYPEGTRINFDHSGRVSSVIYPDDRVSGERSATVTIIQEKRHKAETIEALVADTTFLQAIRIGVDVAKKTIYDVGEKVIFQAEEVSYYPSGKVSYVTLDVETTFHGVRYKGGTGVSFRENGRVSEGILAAGNRDYPEGTRIYFDHSGRVSSVIYPDGRFSEGMSAADATIQTKRHKARTEKVLATDTPFFRGIRVGVDVGKKAIYQAETAVSYQAAETPLSFYPSASTYPSGRVSYRLLDADTIFHGIRYKGGTGVSFHEN